MTPVHNQRLRLSRSARGAKPQARFVGVVLRRAAQAVVDGAAQALLREFYGDDEVQSRSIEAVHRVEEPGCGGDQVAFVGQNLIVRIAVARHRLERQHAPFQSGARRRRRRALDESNWRAGCIVLRQHAWRAGALPRG